MRQKSFPVRVLRPWPRLPREAVAAPGSLAVFKARLDGALGKLGWWRVSLPMAGGWNWMGCEVHYHPNHSMMTINLIYKTFLFSIQCIFVQCIPYYFGCVV